MRIARSLEDEVLTTARGFRKATSVYGTLTGLGGDIFIIDDPQKPVDAQSDTQRNRLNQWVSNTLMSRLDSKERGVVIVVMQRVHPNDLSGYLMESGGWEVLSLPAIAEQDETILIGENRVHHRRVGDALHPELESLASLEKLRRQISSYDFAAQYQQCPVPPGGAMIRQEWLRYFDHPPERTYRTQVIQSWDTAAKDGAQNDWSVCTTWMIIDGDYYLIDLTRGRYEYPRLRETAIELAKRHRPRCVLIEDASTGIALQQELKRIDFGGTTTLVKIERDKIGRLYVNQAKFEAGHVLFQQRAFYLPELLAELLAFPHGKTDDQVDSISQALNHKLSGYPLDNLKAPSPGHSASTFHWTSPPKRACMLPMRDGHIVDVNALPRLFMRGLGSGSTGIGPVRHDGDPQCPNPKLRRTSLLLSPARDAL